jgi:uncharacterized protein (DUF1501 family)
MKRNVSRREFVRLGSSALATGGLLAGARWRTASAAPVDTSGYKAIVCLFMYGGNNSFNMVVPTSQAGYSAYATARTNLALANSSLLPLNGVASDGNSYGLHPALPEMQAIFNSGNAAVICNVGTLVQPVTPAQAQSGSYPLPSQLFSHIDQQTSWMTSIADATQRYGWAGRVADLMAAQGMTANLAFNITVGVDNYWQAGQVTVPYTLGSGGAPNWDAATSTGYRNGARAQAAQALVSQAASDPNLMIQQYAGIQNNAAAKVTLVTNALAAAGDLKTPFTTVPNDSGLAAQLHEVARVIKAQSQIGDARQFFFVSVNGFDSHNNELAMQQAVYPIVSKNIGSFWAAMNEIGMQDNVTLFTASDFGRTLSSNGNGSDHGWGGHSYVVGGAVKGGYYGQMPSLVIGGANDFGSGRLVPTTSTDQYAATLSRWFGVSTSDLNTVFPNLKNFATPYLGFLG